MVAIDSKAFMLKYSWPNMNANMVTLKADSELLIKIREAYQEYMIADDGEYVLFRAKKDTTIITAYKNTKSKLNKITFAGQGFLHEAKKWDATLTINEKNYDSEEPLGWFMVDDQIGSDEVGTGDFFGPICVCAAYVRKEDVAYLRKIGVTDSKKISDDYILKITPQLIKKFSYSQVSLNNEKYNELTSKKININEMKARLHNRVLLNLIKKHNNVKHVFVDQFVSETKFMAYASRDKEIARNVVFKTKGESRFPSVALASVIARYSFLKKMEALGKKYDCQFPFGASAKVDAFAQFFIDRFGKEEMNKVAKINFANYKRI
jgi:ribonuclease HIII